MPQTDAVYCPEIIWLENGGRFLFPAKIKREELDKAEVIIPDDETYSKLTMTLSPIIDTIINNRVENRRLSEIQSMNVS